MLYRAEHGLLPPAERAAAESDVAGLASEAAATFGVEWLQPLLQHSESNESSLAKTSRSVRRPCQADIDGSAGFLPCQPGRQCTGPRQSSSFARHDTLASSPQLLIKRQLSAGCTGRDVASMEKRLYEQSSDVVLQALVDAR